jgi:ABC-type phosphate transport system substrate-binding protein
LGSKDFASRPFEASFLEADPDANRIAGMQFRVVIAGLAVVTSVPNLKFAASV